MCACVSMGAYVCVCVCGVCVWRLGRSDGLDVRVGVHVVCGYGCVCACVCVPLCACVQRHTHTHTHCARAYVCVSVCVCGEWSWERMRGGWLGRWMDGCVGVYGGTLVIGLKVIDS